MICSLKNYIRTESEMDFNYRRLILVMDFLNLIVFFIIINKAYLAEDCTLSTLYKSDEVKFAVYENLGQIFDIKFDEVIAEAKSQSSYLVNPANHFRRKIKRNFIEDGQPLETIEDLDIALKKFNYLSIGSFREDKREFERNRKNGRI